MSRTNQDLGPDIPLRPDNDKRMNPDDPAAGADREAAVSDVEGTGGDVENLGAAGGASNAGRSRTSGGDA